MEKRKGLFYFFLLINLILLNYACSINRTNIKKFTSIEDAHYITNVAFYKQRANTCGLVALASVLNYWKVDFDYSLLFERLYSPRLKGTLDFEIKNYAEKLNLWAKFYQGDLEDLKEKIKKDIPLIVLQKEFPILRNFHYIVVLGFNDKRQRIIAHYGRKPDVQIPYRKFLRSWQKADFATILICPPQKVDWRLSAAEYIELGTLLERNNLLDLAEKKYLEAKRLLPQEKIIYFNLGNVYFKKNLLTQAKTFYQKAIEFDRNFADAYNNLAYLYLAENKNLEEAKILVERALELDSQNKAEYLDTLNKINQRLKEGR